MAMAVFSPIKLQLINQASPRGSARKRSLFPSNSPQTNDLGLISELYSDDSDVYSPPLVSPSSSVTPGKDKMSPCRVGAQALKGASLLDFKSSLSKLAEKSPRRSPRHKSADKENMSSSKLRHKDSPRRSIRKEFLERENFDDHFVTVLSGSPEESEIKDQYEMKRTDSFTTPKKSTIGSKEVRRSPRSASKQNNSIKPNNFYGKLAPVLATNQTNRIQGMKCVFRPPQQSRAKAKLMFEEKPSRKRERSRSLDVIREAKKRKPVFTGVHHAIPRPVKRSPPSLGQQKQESLREKARKVTDLSRTPYGNRRKKEGWEYTLRFTKPMRSENTPTGEKRKFFKTIIKDSPTFNRGISNEFSPPFVPQKRIKLLDNTKSYLSPEKPDVSASDLSDLIEDQNSERLQDKPEVDDILLRLEEDDEEEKKREAEREMLMNILEDSPNKIAAIDSLSNCTASLDLNDSLSESRCSRFVLDETEEDQNTPPHRFFSIFNKSLSKVTPEGSHRKSSEKKKWLGTGKDQLQIDAGQAKFGASQCAECGMLYQVGEAEDEMQHEVFHNSLTVLRHTPWKNEHMVGSYGLDYVIMITGDDPKSWQRKAQDILNLVDKSLGISSNDNSNVMHNHKVFLYISDKHIVGCMVATPVSRAYKMISSESDVDICSEESYPVRCGVSRMWTLYSHRRRGIASKLLDTVRRNFMYGYILPREETAFSIPTPDGKCFATKYMESPNFLVYTGY